MTWSDRVVSCAWVAILILAAGSGVAQPLAPEAPVTTATNFLADPSLPAFPERRDTIWKPDKRNPFFSITLENRRGATSYVLVAEAGDRVIEYDALLPLPPLPDATIPREQARQIALDFARRHLPELFAEGGAVLVEPQEKVTANGAYSFTLFRTAQNARLLTRARVGVRVYDGKVVHWRSDLIPPTVPLTAGVTLEQAQASATESLAKGYYTPVQWLDGFLEVIWWGKEQKLVWRVWVQAKRPQEAADYIGDIWIFEIDAADGKIARTKKMGGRDLYEYYVQKSGKELPPWPFPDAVFADHRPTLSPDGRRLLFASSRPRRGYPEWMVSRGLGLFIANADGTGVSCLVPAVGGHPKWRSLSEVAYLGSSGIVLHNLDDGRQTVLTPEKDWQYGSFVSLPDGRIITVACYKQGATKLWILDPAKPDAGPTELPSKSDFITRHVVLMLDPQGRLLYTMKTQTGITTNDDPRRRTEPYRLCRMDLKAAQPTEEMLAEYLSGGNSIQWGPQGLLYLSKSEAGLFQTVDVATGTTGEWRAPRPEQPECERKRLVSPDSIVFSQDGQSFLFTSYYSSAKPGDQAADVIYSCGIDGTGIRLVTRPDKGLAPVFTFAATGKAAFE
jgi:hypothetical protein